jgi:two-component system phosphate regulon response regulator OmpR
MVHLSQEKICYPHKKECDRVSPPHILIVDDDKRLRTLLRRYLMQEKECFVTTAASVLEARKALTLFRFDGLVVDVMMPGGQGTDLLAVDHIPPLILLSAMGEPHHRIHGLELGAHDYIAKPFEPKELVLRLFNSIQRKTSVIKLGSLVYCCRQRVLTHRDHTPVVLSHSESQLLHYFACRPHRPLSRQEIAQCLFPETTNLRIVDVQVNRLRKKIEENPETPLFLVSLRGQGYALTPTS